MSDAPPTAALTDGEDFDADPLQVVWAAFDTPLPLFTAEEVGWWPAGTLDALLSAGLLAPATCASHVACPDCADRHLEEVTRHPYPDGRLRFFIPCPQAGRAEVAADSLRQWQPDFPILARRVKELLGLDNRVSERLPGRVWRLGVVEWNRQPREVYLARGLAWPDGDAAMGVIPGDGGPIVLAGLTPPPPSSWPKGIPAAVTLAAAMELRRGALRLDAPLLARLVNGADQTARRFQSVSDADLARRIDHLAERRLKEGSKDDLVAGLDRMGLSSREAEEEMKKRGVAMDHTTFARKKRNMTGSTGRKPSSSNSVLRDPSSQPRDTRGKPIKDAQPKQNE